MRLWSCIPRQRPLLFAAIAVILLLTAMSCLAACGETEVIDPQEQLARASTNMKGIAGFHFVYEVHKPQGSSPAPGLDIARIQGDIDAEGDMQASIDVTQGGIPLSLEFVAAGDTHYIENPLSQKWESVPAADSPVGSLSLTAGTIRILDEITDVTYVGREKKGGTQTYHISGMVAAEEVAAIAGAVSTTDPFPTDLWIGVDDGLVYEVDIHGPAVPSEDAKVWRSIILSNLDVHVDIKAPQ